MVKAYEGFCSILVFAILFGAACGSQLSAYFNISRPQKYLVYGETTSMDFLRCGGGYSGDTTEGLWVSLQTPQNSNFSNDDNTQYVSNCTPSMPPRGQFVFVSSAYCALGIKSVSFKDSGLYQCQVSSGRRSQFRSVRIKLQVYDRFILNTSDQNSPIVVVEETNRVVLKCHINQQNNLWGLSVSWIRFGSGVIQTERADRVGSSFDLALESASRNDSGVYQCSIRNFDGMVIDSGNETLLRVQYAPTAKFFLSQKAVKGNVTNSSILTYQDLNCVADGYPLPYIVIFRDDEVLFSEQINNTMIQKVRHDDDGLYCCRASSRLGNSTECLVVKDGVNYQLLVVLLILVLMADLFYLGFWYARRKGLLHRLTCLRGRTAFTAARRASKQSNEGYVRLFSEEHESLEEWLEETSFNDEDDVRDSYHEPQAPTEPRTERVSLYVNKQQVICSRKATSSLQIGMKGGELSLSLYGVLLIIPPEAIRSATGWLDVTLSLFISDTPVNVDGKTVYVALTELLPHKTRFLKQVTLRHELARHSKFDSNCVETQFQLFYGEGIDPLETYNFMGSVESACRRATYKDMELSLLDDSIQLSSFSFCLHCSVITIGTFGIMISFFVLSKGIDQNEQWEVRIAISCGCEENQEKIKREQRGMGYHLVTGKSICCYNEYLDSQQLAIAIDSEKDHTSRFTQHPELLQFCGQELFHVVQRSTSLPVTKDCTIKCLGKSSSCRQPVRFTCKYGRESSEQASEKIYCDDIIPVYLNGESLYDDRESSGFSLQQKKKRLLSNTETLVEKATPIALEVRGGGDSTSVSPRTDVSLDALMRIERPPSTEELLNLSKRLSNDWKNIARRLGEDEGAIASVENDVKGAIERPYQMLQNWMERKGESATVGRLCKALIMDKKTRTATTIFQPTMISYV